MIWELASGPKEKDYYNQTHVFHLQREYYCVQF